MVNLIKDEPFDSSEAYDSTVVSPRVVSRPREWIKVHCDARYALQLRTVFDKWSAVERISSSVLAKHSAPSVGKSGTDNARKRFVLKGMRLVFIDELGRPVVVA